MKRILACLVLALVLTSCGRNLGRVAPNVGRVEGVEYRVVDFMTHDSSGCWMRILLHNTNKYPADVYLLQAAQGGDTLAVRQTSFVTVIPPLSARLAPGEWLVQEYLVSSGRTTPIRLDGWHVYPLESMDAPSTRALAQAWWRDWR